MSLPEALEGMMPSKRFTVPMVGHLRSVLQNTHPDDRRNILQDVESSSELPPSVKAVARRFATVDGNLPYLARAYQQDPETVELLLSDPTTPPFALGVEYRLPSPSSASDARWAIRFTEANLLHCGMSNRFKTHQLLTESFVILRDAGDEEAALRAVLMAAVLTSGQGNFSMDSLRNPEEVAAIFEKTLSKALLEQSTDVLYSARPTANTAASVLWWNRMLGVPTDIKVPFSLTQKFMDDSGTCQEMRDMFLILSGLSAPQIESVASVLFADSGVSLVDAVNSVR